MFPSISRNFLPLKQSSSVITRKNYSQKVKQYDFIHLFKSLVCHIERTNPSWPKKMCGKKAEAMRHSISTPIAHEIIFKSAEINSFEKIEPQIKTILQDSLVESMTKIMSRVEDSKKGVMYRPSYYLEIENNHIGYENYIDEIHRNVKNEEFPCFNLGEDLCHFITKNNIPASYAIESFLEGPTAADCASLVEAVFLKAINDVLGKEKFNELFQSRKSKMQIRRWGPQNTKSSLFPFTQFVDPKIFNEIDENELEIGDHICLPGVPWYHLKHPLSVMGNLHAVVVGYTKAKEPLIGALGLENPATIRQIKQGLVDSYNSPQTKAEIKYLQKYSSKSYLSPFSYHKDLSGYHFDLKDIDEEFIFKNYTVEELSALGALKIENYANNRLSTFVLAALKTASDDADLRCVLNESKAISLARQFKTLYEPIKNDLDSYRNSEKYQ